MTLRESVIPLTFGAIASLIVHVTVLAKASQWLTVSSEAHSTPWLPINHVDKPIDSKRIPPNPPDLTEPPPHREPTIPVGHEEGTAHMTIAWIAHKNFQKLQSTRRAGLQPSLQRQVDPVPEAAVTPEPTPPTLAQSQAQMAHRPAPERLIEPPVKVENEVSQVVPIKPKEDVEADSPPTDQAPALARQRSEGKPVEGPQRVDAPSSPQPGTSGLELTRPVSDLSVLPREDTALAERVPQQDDDRSRGDAATLPETLPAGEGTAWADPPANVKPATLEAVPRSKRRVGDQQSKPQRSGRPNATLVRPTSAAKSKRESDLFSDEESLATRPGSVITTRGIQIRTVRPRFSSIAARFAAPRNPLAQVQFDHETGLVLSARILHSSGFPNVDGPVLSSLYSWRAKGKMLAERDEPFTVKIRIVLMR